MSKKSLVYLIGGIIVFLAVLSLVYFYSVRLKPAEEKVSTDEKTPTELIRELTAPVGERETPQPSEETIKALTAPEGVAEPPETIIQGLTPSNNFLKK